MAKRVLILDITPEMTGRTIKNLLGAELHMAPSLISRTKLRDSGILLNGKSAHTDVCVRTGDVLSVDVSDISPWNPAEPVDFPLEIVYEDADLAILNKPAGMAVHGANGGSVTVASVLAYRWGQDVSFHPVSRLDKGTSGLMAVAKSAYAHDRLRRMLHTPQFLRQYIAIAEGLVSPCEGRIELSITEKPTEGTRRAVSSDGLPCRTDYRVLASGGGLTLLSVLPMTGRTHQIRVHFSAVGHPLAGDAQYGGGTECIQRPALHSARIHLVQPVTGTLIDVSAPLPADMAELAGGVIFKPIKSDKNE